METGCAGAGFLAQRSPFLPGGLRRPFLVSSLSFAALLASVAFVASVMLVACGGKSTRSEEGNPAGGSPSEVCLEPFEECAQFAEIYCSTVAGCFAQARGDTVDEAEVERCRISELERCQDAFEEEELPALRECLSDLEGRDCPSFLGRVRSVSGSSPGVLSCLPFAPDTRQGEYLATFERTGEPASQSDACENPWLVFEDGFCVAGGVAGEDCAARECSPRFPLRCEEGVCVRSGREGAPCGTSDHCDTGDEFQCVAMECTRILRAPEGGQCGYLQEYTGEEFVAYTVLCEEGLVCGNYSDLGFGQCLVPLDLGDTCSFASPCEEGAQCEDGICQALPVYCD